jgi:hypothetical protein
MSFDYERAGERTGQSGQRDYAFRAHERIDFGHTAHRWLDWIKTRPSESWVFFAAGLVLGGILM